MTDLMTFMLLSWLVIGVFWWLTMIKTCFFNILQQEQNNAIKVFLTTSNFFILVESTEKI
jgi:hypothetical protein